MTWSLQHWGCYYRHLNSLWPSCLWVQQTRVRNILLGRRLIVVVVAPAAPYSDTLMTPASEEIGGGSYLRCGNCDRVAGRLAPPLWVSGDEGVAWWLVIDDGASVESQRAMFREQVGFVCWAREMDVDDSPWSSVETMTVFSVPLPLLYVWDFRTFWGFCDWYKTYISAE